MHEVLETGGVTVLLRELFGSGGLKLRNSLFATRLASKVFDYDRKDHFDGQAQLFYVKTDL